MKPIICFHKYNKKYFRILNFSCAKRIKICVPLNVWITINLFKKGLLVIANAILICDVMNHTFYHPYFQRLCGYAVSVHCFLVPYDWLSVCCCPVCTWMSVSDAHHLTSYLILWLFPLMSRQSTHPRFLYSRVYN